MKILIADDEDYSREGLIESIDWEAFGVTDVMQAVNGQETLKTAKWNGVPDFSPVYQNPGQVSRL